MAVVCWTSSDVCVRWWWVQSHFSGVFSYIKSAIEGFLYELKETCWCFSFKLLSELCCLRQPSSTFCPVEKKLGCCECICHHLTNAFWSGHFQGKHFTGVPSGHKQQWLYMMRFRSQVFGFTLTCFISNFGHQGQCSSGGSCCCRWPYIRASRGS